MLTEPQINNALYALHDCFVDLSDLVLSILHHGDHCQPAYNNLVHQSVDIMTAFNEQPFCTVESERWALSLSRQIFHRDVQTLISADSGLRFIASRARSEQIDSFKIDSLGTTMHRAAPHIWQMMDDLLTASSGPTPPLYSRNNQMEVDVPEGTDHEQLRQTLERKLIKTHKVIITSTIAQHNNQRCNALGSVMGIFLHASNAPQRIIEVLAHAGISISPSSILSAVGSLSRESVHDIHTLAKTITIAIAYDNFDVELKQKVPLTNKPNDKLHHLTSATILPLHHTTLADLKCAHYLWERSRFNVRADPALVSKHRYQDLFRLHPETRDVNGMLRQDRFNAWKLLDDLCRHGPEYFQKFIPRLGAPENIELVPISVMKQVPLKAMNLPNSSMEGNIQTLKEIFQQLGYNDPKLLEELKELGELTEYVMLCHGDLGSGERIELALRHRSIEKSVRERLENILFIPGLFHIKMACVDAIWRAFIQPLKSRDDPTSLTEHVGTLRPTDSGKIGSGPTFQVMHDVITHDGIVERLECWRTETAHQHPDQKWESLDGYAAAEPTWDDIVSVANTIATQYMDANVPRNLRKAMDSDRDKQHENVLLRNQMFLLYENFVHALNHGNVGRIESLLVMWIPIFKCTGKHKYADHVTRFLTDLHFVYPEGLRRVVRMNWMCNLTGKADGFRGIDWLVELNNLYLKRIYCGSGSNHTVQRIIDESTQIEIYRECLTRMENSFALTTRTVQHSPPNMASTFQKLGDTIKSNSLFVKQPGRSSGHEVPDFAATGFRLIKVGQAALAARQGRATMSDTSTGEHVESVVVDEADVIVDFPVDV